MTTEEKGSDAMLPEDYDPSIIVAAGEATSDAEEARVEAVDPLDDPGEDYPPPEPTQDDPGGFDPLP